MPLNPLEYMPEGLRRQIDNCLSISKEAQLNRRPNSDASVLFPPSVLENVDFSMKPPVKQVNTMTFDWSVKALIFFFFLVNHMHDSVSLYRMIRTGQSLLYITQPIAK